MMGERATGLAKRFLDVHACVLEVIQNCPEPDILSCCEGENESVGAVANHIAAGYHLEMLLVSASLSGQPAPDIYCAEDESVLDEYHAMASLQYSRYTKTETLAHLQEKGEEAHQFLCQLDDGDLEKTIHTSMILKWFGQPISVETWIENVLIGHPYSHLSSIQKTLGLKTTST